MVSDGLRKEYPDEKQFYENKEALRYSSAGFTETLKGDYDEIVSIYMILSLHLLFLFENITSVCIITTFLHYDS